MKLKLLFIALVFGGALGLPASSIKTIDSGFASEEMILSGTKRIDPVILTILIETYAAPHWNLSISDAWAAYQSKQMVITEIIPGKQYSIAYSGDVLTVILDGGY